MGKKIESARRATFEGCSASPLENTKKNKEAQNCKSVSLSSSVQTPSEIKGNRCQWDTHLTCLEIPDNTPELATTNFTGYERSMFLTNTSLIMS